MVIFILTVVYIILFLYLLVMWARFLLDLVVAFSRGWRPKGFGLVLAELVYTITDPPLRAVRKRLPPVRFGGITLDFAWSLVLLVVLVLLYVVSWGRQLAAAL